MTRFQLVFGGWIVSLIAGGCTLIMGDPEVVRRDGNSSGQGNLAGNSSAGSSGQGGANAISGNSTSGNGGVGNSLWSNHAGQSGNAASSATNSAGTPLTAGAAGVAGQVASMVGGASNGGASGAGAAGASSGAAGYLWCAGPRLYNRSDRKSRGLSGACSLRRSLRSERQCPGVGRRVRDHGTSGSRQLSR